MKQKSSRDKDMAVIALLDGAAAFALGILNNFFTSAVTFLSLFGMLSGIVGIVLAIIVRKSHKKAEVAMSSAGLVLSIVGFLWNTAFFVACSLCSIGVPNIV